MTDYELIGRVFVWLGCVSLAILTVIGISKLFWVAFRNIVGWSRIAKALRMLRASESKGEDG